jgi:triphosphatase
LERPEAALPAPREYELKLAIDAGAAPRLGAMPLLAGAQRRTEHLKARYFDTPDRSLQRAGLSLRIRSGGSTRVQTLKRSNGSLVERGEWERPTVAEEPNLATLRDTPLPDLGKIEALAPLVETDVRRTAWTVERDGAVLEVALDEGDIRANGRAAPISQLEVELKDGRPAALFDVARAIDGVVPVRLSVQSKAETGFALFDATPRRAHKADPRPLPRGLTLAEGLRAMAQDCLRHYGLNEPLLMEAQDPEAVHQCRVALRRLRAVFWLFKPKLEGARPLRFRNRLKTLSDAFGKVRNLDVILAGPLRQAVADAPGDGAVKALQDLATARRAQLAEELVGRLKAAEFRRLMIDLVEWLEVDLDSDPAFAGRPLRPFVRRRVIRASSRIRNEGRKLGRRSEAERHAVRIRAKKLRYVLELAAPKRHPRRRRAYLQALQEVQVHFGALQDLASLRACLSDLGTAGTSASGAVPAGAVGFAAGYIAGLEATRREALLDQARRAHRAFRAARSPPL